MWLATDVSYAFANVVPKEKLIITDSPIAYMKAIKNNVEIQGKIDDNRGSFLKRTHNKKFGKRFYI